MQLCSYIGSCLVAVDSVGKIIAGLSGVLPDLPALSDGIIDRESFQVADFRSKKLLFIATYFQRVNIVVWHHTFKNFLKSEDICQAVTDSDSVDYLIWIKS